MSLSDELKSILYRIEIGNHTVADVAALRRLLSSGSYQVVQQLDSKYNIHIGQGQNVQIAERLPLLHSVQTFCQTPPCPAMPRTDR